MVDDPAFGYLSILAVLAACGYAFLGPERFGGLNPIGKASEAEAGAERASAKYTLAIVAGQLDQVHVVTGTYADTLDFDHSFVRLVRADHTPILEYKKTQERPHRRPTRHRHAGHLLITRSS